jgi:hypothetical protein
MVLSAPLAALLAERLGLTPAEREAFAAGDLEAALGERLAGHPELIRMLADRRAKTEERTDAGAGARHALRYVAQVLGACSCWGQNPACPRCQGRGAPGAFSSADPGTLLAWVEPALRRIGRRSVPNQAAAATTDPSAQSKEA